LALGDLLGLFAGVQPDASVEAHIHGGHPAHSLATPSTRHDNETLNLGDLLGLFGGVHPDHQRANPPQKLTSRTPSQPHSPQAAEP